MFLIRNTIVSLRLFYKPKMPPEMNYDVFVQDLPALLKIYFGK